MKQFVIDLPNLKWNREALIAQVKQFPDSNWLKPTDHHYINTYAKAHDSQALTEILSQLSMFNVSTKRCQFSKIAPFGTLPMHIDGSQKCAIVLPLIGEWHKSLLRFHAKYDNDPINSIICQHQYTENMAAALNVLEPHSVLNASDQERYILLIGFDAPWQEVLDFANS